MRVDKTEELAQLLADMKAWATVFTKREYGKCVRVYCDFMEFLECSSESQGPYTAEWVFVPGHQFFLSTIHISRFDEDVAVLSCVINVLKLNQHKIIDAEYVPAIGTLGAAARLIQIDAEYVPAIAELLKSTINFERLKEMCIEKGVFTEVELETELLKRTVKS